MPKFEMDWMKQHLKRNGKYSNSSMCVVTCNREKRKGNLHIMQPSERTATAVACPNTTLIKYWGNRDDKLRIPSNGSISMNLDGLFTRIYVCSGSQKLDSILNRN